jgi:hypothetical protein
MFLDTSRMAPAWCGRSETRSNVSSLVGIALFSANQP